MGQSVFILLAQLQLPSVIGLNATFAVAGALTAVGGNLLLAAGVSALTQPDVPSAPRPEDIQTNSKVAAGPRVGHYGVVKTGGTVVFHRAKDGTSYRVIVHGADEVSQVLQYYLNNEPVPVDAFGRVTDSQYVSRGGNLGTAYGAPLGGDAAESRVRIFHRAGLVPETHYSELTDIWPAWTADHRLDGLWSSLLICESASVRRHRRVYPFGEPAIQALAETRACFDPRTQQSGATENAALIIADFVAHPDGLNRPGAFDDPNIITQAEICDLDVPLAQGGTEAQWRLSGSFRFDEKPQTVLERMLTACAGRVRLAPTGKLDLRVGAWREPTVTLTYADILEVRDVNAGPDLLERYNELPARFVSHALGHVEVDAEPFLDATRVASDGEVLTGSAMDALMSPSHRQTRHAMKIKIARDNPPQGLSIVFKPGALSAAFEDTIALEAPELGLVGTYEVQDFDVALQQGVIGGILLQLRAMGADAFELALSEQGAVQTLPEPDTPSGVPIPINVTAAAAGIQVAGNVFAAGIGVAWQAPPSDALEALVRYAPAGTDAWQSAPVAEDATSVTLPGLVDGALYDVAVAFVTPGGVVGPEVIIEDVPAAAATETPAPPTEMTVLDAGGGQALVEMVASDTASLWQTEIYRDGVLVGRVYAGPGEPIAFVDQSGAGTFDWTARSVNVSGGTSALAGPINQAIA